MPGANVGHFFTVMLAPLKSAAGAPCRQCRAPARAGACRVPPSARRRPAGSRLNLGGEIAHRRLALEQVLDLLARQRLVFEQPARDRVQIVDILRQDLARVLEGFIDDAVNFLVDPGLGLVGQILRPSDGMAEKHLLLVVAVSAAARACRTCRIA